MQLHSFETKLPILKLKIWSRQLLDYFPLSMTLSETALLYVKTAWTFFRLSLVARVLRKLISFTIFTAVKAKNIQLYIPIFTAGPQKLV